MFDYLASLDYNKMGRLWAAAGAAWALYECALMLGKAWLARTRA
ncbi:hypothetical protein RA280_16055 [Cupriavidus sp. CV2]|nr:hypothetical protein [Cupriavidus sp. CV2]MDW3683237.1 hypothetical protein [Cupriavidus sp. CV2]